MLQAGSRLNKPVVSRGEARADEVLEMVADAGKAKRIFGWEPRVPLPEGLPDRQSQSEPGAGNIPRSGRLLKFLNILVT